MMVLYVVRVILCHDFIFSFKPEEIPLNLPLINNLECTNKSTSRSNPWSQSIHFTCGYIEYFIYPLTSSVKNWVWPLKIELDRLAPGKVRTYSPCLMKPLGSFFNQHCCWECEQTWFYLPAFRLNYEIEHYNNQKIFGKRIELWWCLLIFVYIVYIFTMIFCSHSSLKKFFWSFFWIIVYHASTNQPTETIHQASPFTSWMGKIEH